MHVFKADISIAHKPSTNVIGTFNQDQKIEQHTLPKVVVTHLFLPLLKHRNVQRGVVIERMGVTPANK